MQSCNVLFVKGPLRQALRRRRRRRQRFRDDGSPRARGGTGTMEPGRRSGTEGVQGGPSGAGGCLGFTQHRPRHSSAALRHPRSSCAVRSRAHDREEAGRRSLRDPLPPTSETHQRRRRRTAENQMLNFPFPTMPNRISDSFLPTTPSMSLLNSRMTFVFIWRFLIPKIQSEPTFIRNSSSWQNDRSFCPEYL